MLNLESEVASYDSLAYPKTEGKKKKPKSKRTTKKVNWTLEEPILGASNELMGTFTGSWPSLISKLEDRKFRNSATTLLFFPVCQTNPDLECIF